MPTDPAILGYGSSLVSLGGGIASVFVGYRQAKELEDRAIREAKRIRRAGDKILGAQTVAYAHGGVTQAGTPQDVRNDSIAEIERSVFASTQGFEDAANRNIDMGWLNLAGALSQASTTAAVTAAGRPGSTALFAPRGGVTGGIRIGAPGGRAVQATGGPTALTVKEAGRLA